MTDSTFLAQFLAVALFAACLIHSWNTEGRRNAQQWFLIGYIFSLLLVNLLVVIQQIAYNSALLVIGAAPSLSVMFFPAILYLAYIIAKFLVAETDLPAMAYLIFLITPALMLPLDATGIQLGWWSFSSESLDFINGVPFYVPFAWGVTGAVFFLMIGRIRKIRFRGSGQFFAMMIAAPILAGVVLALIAILQVLVNLLNAIGGIDLLYSVLGVLFLALPIAFAFDFPRMGRREIKEKGK